MAHAGGRPRKYDINDIIVEITKYIDSTDEPYIQEFCINYDISEDQLSDYRKENSELSGLVKKLLKKQELYIVKNASTGKINPVFGIFRLKQKCFGYTDKAELDITATQAQPDPEQLREQLRELLGTLDEDTKMRLLEDNCTK